MTVTAPTESVAVTVIVSVLTAAGMPLRTPVIALKVNPAGNGEENANWKVFAPVPPVTCFRF